MNKNNNLFIHVCRSDHSLLTIHTTDVIREGYIISTIYGDVPVLTLKETVSSYYQGFRFYEVNFKKDKI